jgi:hypothetical protein
MNPKLEKYYNYIVDDMHDKNYFLVVGGEKEIQFPWLEYSTTFFECSYQFRFWREELKFFKEYVIHNYGARDTDINSIWRIYSEKYDSLYCNENDGY